jgi:NAD(P)-dependent dehydrogenase (short-subunit alcohol dehydrogenase family)
MISNVVDDSRFDDLLRDPFAAELTERAMSVFQTGAEAYIYAKRGLLHRSRRLALDWAPDVRVNTVSPGFIDTPMTARGMAVDEWTRKSAARIPLRRFGRPSEVGAVIEFLLSDAASYLTGVDVPIDGGSLASRQVHMLDRAKSQT